KALEDSLASSKYIVVISVSIDTDKSRWQKSVQAGEYGGIQALNLFTGGVGAEDPFLRYYGINSFPTLMIIDRNGYIYEAAALAPRSQQAMIQLKEMLEQAAK
ncbi:MAG: thioredoxin family protein, partial [Chitinophagaceae bacterium]|nr:thioredoxin family protein [Chitinophagaceae bacterium]